MIDTHCHLDHPVFDLDRAAVLARSVQAGVGQWVVPGVRLGDFPAVAALHSPNIYIALGLHPLFLPDHPADAMGRLVSWIERIKPLAVGEIGLDFLAPPQTHAGQERLLEQQLLLAASLKLPVLLHVRRAHDRVLDLLKHCSFSAGGIVHAYNGSLQQAYRYIERGFGLGFGGVVTRERSLKIRKLAALVPEESLVLETDAPDLPPGGYFGERNEPAYLPLVAQTLAQLRRVSVAHIQTVTHHNASVFLGLKKW